MWFPHSDISYSIYICVWKTILQSIVPKGVHLKEAPEEIVDSLHGSEGSRMNRNKSNRGRGREKRRPAGDLRRPSQATARRVRGHEPFQPGADRRPGADPRGYRAGGERPAQQPHGLRCRLARRIRRATAARTISARTFRPSASRIRPLFCFLMGSMVTRSDDIEQSSNNFGQCSKMIEDCSQCVRKSLEPSGRA
jgi:hypothetical protein